MGSESPRPGGPDPDARARFAHRDAERIAEAVRFAQGFDRGRYNPPPPPAGAPAFQPPAQWVVKVTAVPSSTTPGLYEGVCRRLKEYFVQSPPAAPEWEDAPDQEPCRVVHPAGGTLAVDDVGLGMVVGEYRVDNDPENPPVPIFALGAAGGGDGGFWAALVTKSGSLCPSYTFRRVTKTVAGCGWTVDAPAASPEGPLYEVNACDLPINDPVTDDPAQFVVVRARPGDGEFFVFEMAPRWEFIRTTSTEPDAGTGYYPAFVLYFPTGGSDPGDAEEVWGWDLNTSP